LVQYISSKNDIPNEKEIRIKRRNQNLRPQIIEEAINDEAKSIDKIQKL